MKKIFAIALCLILVIGLAACGASKDAEAELYSMQSNTAMMDMFVAENSAADSAGGASVTSSPSATKPDTEEKIIKTVVLHVQTKEYTAYISSINESVASLGGYVEKSGSDLGPGSNYNRSATYVVRIPAEKLDAFLESANEKGTVTSINEEQQNVTLEYVDLESRISAFKTERESLTKLLENAESLENILAIQERLSEVNYEIENYTAQLRVLANRVSYSTVTLNIREVERVTEQEPTLWSRIKNRFLDNLDDLIDGLKNAVVDIVGGLPILLPIAVVAVIAVLIIRKLIKKRKAKRNI